MIDVEILCETFGILKEYIPAKDKQASADHLFSVLTDLEISEKDLKTFAQCDPCLQKSCAEYFQGDDDDENEDNYNFDDYDQDD